VRASRSFLSSGDASWKDNLSVMRHFDLMFIIEACVTLARGCRAKAPGFRDSSRAKQTRRAGMTQAQRKLTHYQPVRNCAVASRRFVH